MTRYTIMRLLTSLLLAAESTGHEDTAKKDQERLEGAWVCVSEEIEGKVRVLDEGRGIVLIFQGNKLTEQSAKQTATESLFKLDPSKKPKSMDITVTKDVLKVATGMNVSCIYALENDSLKIAYPIPGHTKRPDTFVTKEGSRHFVLTYKRKDGK